MSRSKYFIALPRHAWEWISEKARKYGITKSDLVVSALIAVKEKVSLEEAIERYTQKIIEEESDNGREKKQLQHH